MSRSATWRPRDERRRSGLLPGLAIAVAGPGVLCAVAPVSSLEGKPLLGGPFLLVVLFATLAGGFVPALVATATSFVGLMYFYVEPVHSLRLTGSSLASLVVWVASAAVLTAILDRRRRAFELLRSSGQAAAFALERGDVGAWELAPASQTLWLSPDAERLFGLPKGTFDGRPETMLAFVHPDDVTPTRDALNRIAAGALEVTTDFRIVRPDGERRSLELRGGAVAGAESGTSALAGILSDVTERLAREDQLRFLSDVSTTLASSLDPRETLAQVAALVVPRLSDWCSIDLVEEGAIRTLAVHHADPDKADRARRLLGRYPPAPDAPTGAPNVIRTGRSELYGHIGDDLLVAGAHDEEHLAALRGLDLSCAIVAPLTARGQTLGALTLVGEGARRFGEQDLALAEEVARRAAVAVDNAHLHQTQAAALADAERAHARTARLQSVTDALSETMTRADVARVLLREGLVALQAQAGAVYELAANGRTFETLDSVGYPEGLEPERAPFEATATGPAAEAIRTRTLVVVESPGDLRSRWPQLAQAQDTNGDLATLTAPLLVGDEPVGALHMTFRQPRSFDENDLSLARTLVRQGAQALERARLYEQEQLAREQAERLAGRLRRLQNIVDATFMSGALDDVLQELLVRLREAVDCDTAALLIVDDSGDVLIARKAIGFGRPLNTHVPIGQGFAGRIAATRTHQVIRDISQAHVVSSYFRESGIVSLAGVPLIADGRLVGVVHVGSKQMREFDREDILLLRLVAARAAVAIDRARIHEREHGIAEILQRSLLPARLPAIDGVEVAARYVPGTVGVAVGGDWYDVFELADGSIGVVVGDVVGHGLRAAAAMGRLRNVLRAYALEGLGPGETLARLNRLACETDDEIFATVFYALLAPSRTRLRVASAGHPPPLLCSPGCPVRLLEEGRSLPLGADPDAAFIDAEVSIDPGSSLVLYTDGLVERRGESIDAGIERLVRLVSALDVPVDELADRIVDELDTADHTDDLALVAVRIEPVASPTLSLRFPAEPRALAPVRASLRTWLESHGAGAEEVFEILVAANEACSNAVEHPLGPTGTEVGLEAEVVNGALSIVVRDSGSWRPVRRNPDRGRGLDFMQTLMEDVEVVRSDGGTSVRLQRRLRG